MTRVQKVRFGYMPVEELIPYANNPRINDDTEDLEHSIEGFGFINPIILTKDNVILAGHTRLKAALKTGETEVPCIFADSLDEMEGKAYRLADNKIQEKSGWDFPLLALELQDVAESDFQIDMSELGFDIDEGLFEDLPDEPAHTVPAGVEEVNPFEGHQRNMDRGPAVIVNVSCEEEADDLVARLESEGYDCRRI